MTTIRTFKPKQDTPLSNVLQYDVRRPIAIYGRHSSKEQNGNVATKQQTVGLEREALKLGFSTALHRTFYEDLKGVSAYKVPMDERKSYSDLYNAIARGEIGTVLCYLVDRLFRTKNGEEWELFINACAKNNVKVITASPPMRIYDLSVSSDADDFRQKCIAARTYIEEFIKGRLCAARDELGRMGFWAGQGMPIGYYIDFDKDSPTYKQFLVYEPHAEIVRTLFARYREINGVFTKLVREIGTRQLLFPLFEEGIVPMTQLSMNEQKTGYRLGRSGLMSIFTNPVYIGIYTFQGQKIVDNHPAIVNHDDFFYAFNRLSKYDLDGNETEASRSRVNGYFGERRQGIDALLRGKLTSEEYTNITVYSMRQTYLFAQKKHALTLKTSHIAISLLDDVVSNELIKMLEPWKNYMGRRTLPMYGLPPNPYNAFKGLSNEHETVIASIDDQLPALKTRIAKLRRNLDLDADEETLNDWASELKAKVKNLVRLEAKQKTIAESQSSQQEATELMKDVPDKWHQMKFEKKVRAIELFVKDVEVEDVAPHFLRVIITWKLPHEHTVTLYVWRQNGTKDEWTNEEKAIVKEHYPTASVHDMLTLLPSRTWATIKMYGGNTLHLTRTCGTPYNMPINITMQDIEFMRTHGIENLNVKAKVQVFYVHDKNTISGEYL